MAQTITVHCDRCACRVSASDRTRIRWSRELNRSGPADLCRDCAEVALGAVGTPLPLRRVLPAVQGA